MKEKVSTLVREMVTWKTFWEIFRYGIITLISYFFMVAFIWLLKHFAVNEKVAYAIALTINYVGVYYGYNKYVFGTSHNMPMLRRFVIVLICSWIGNNIFFALWINLFHIIYPIAVALNTVVLGALRFMAQKFYVRR